MYIFVSNRDPLSWSPPDIPFPRAPDQLHLPDRDLRGCVKEAQAVACTCNACNAPRNAKPAIPQCFCCNTPCNVCIACNARENPKTFEGPAIPQCAPLQCRCNARCHALPSKPAMPATLPAIPCKTCNICNICNAACKNCPSLHSLPMEPMERST